MPQQVPPPPKYGLRSRTIAAPLTAVIMAGLLFVYSRSAIQAAKRNAQAHREADGGQINWETEARRRHGFEPPVSEQKGTVRELYDEVKRQATGEKFVENKPKRE